MTTKKKSRDRLVVSYENYDINTLTDLLSILMRDIEDALMQCGAVPGEDYTYNDLMNWSIAINTSNKNKEDN